PIACIYRRNQTIGGRYQLTKKRRQTRAERQKTLYPYKSKLEVETQALLPEAPYEDTKIGYLKEHTYNPDFTLGDGIFLECKGRFTAVDRAKHLLIKKQHPEITVYFLFERPYNTLNKASTTTYADWCARYGFEWTTLEQGIPKHWLKTKGKKNNNAN